MESYPYRVGLQIKVSRYVCFKLTNYPQQKLKRQHFVIIYDNHWLITGISCYRLDLSKNGVYKNLHKNATPPARNYTTHMYANTNLKRLILIALLILSHS